MTDQELTNMLNGLGVTGDMNIATSQSGAAGGVLAVMLALGAIAIVFALILALFGVLEIIGRWRIVKRLGGHGWSQLIPVYCDWELSKAVGMSRKFTIAITAVAAALVICIAGNDVELLRHLCFVVVIAAIVLSCVMLRQLSGIYGHGCGYVVGLLLLPGIFYLLLGCSAKEIVVPAKFDEEKPAEPEAPAAE